MKAIHSTIILLLLSILSNVVIAADTKYVRSKVAKIFSEASFASSALKTLKQSEEVDLIRQQGSWSKVKSGNVEGWMPSLLISNSKPLARKTITSDPENSDMQNNARRRASTTTVAGAARGLQSDENEVNPSSANYELLQKIENNVYTDEEIRHFMEEGLKSSE
ncbi:MAG: hypothetical protein OEX12_00405 [Gammaproteobacteria bacterium]|nr:hypothetical protein [Gammaproteobacteria bacterium]